MAICQCAHVPPLRSALQDLSDRDESPAADAAPSTALALRADFEDGEPRVRDVDLASFLGYERPAGIRELINRYRNDLGVIRTVRETSGPAGGRPGKANYLTEQQAAFIIMKSETPRAKEIAKQVAAVFVAWRNGRLAPSAPQLPPVVDLLAKLQEQSDRKFERDG